MKVCLNQPFGAIVTGFDLRNESHPSLLWGLVMKHGVVIIPGDGIPEKAPKFYDKENFSTLAKKMGTIPEYHPTNDLGDDGVQELATLGDGDRRPDAYLFHTDTSWVPQPSHIGMLSCKLCPPSGGNTLFVNSNSIYQKIPKKLQERLHNLYAWHSYRTFYDRLDSTIRFKNEKDDGALHPAIIKHPIHGYPVLYVNENSTSHFLDISGDESKILIKELSKYINENCIPVVEHSWSRGDIVLWDDIGMQHLARRDYKSRRIMMRAHSSTYGYRTERYMPRFIKLEFGVLLKANPPSNLMDVIYYDSLSKKESYQIPTITAKLVVGILLNMKGETRRHLKLLDIGGGTGLFQHELKLRLKEFSNWSCDYVDSSQLMTREAERKDIYKNHYNLDVNAEGLPFAKKDEYTGVISLCSIGANQIYFKTILREVKRVLIPGGFAVFVVLDNVHLVVDFLEENGMYLLKRSELYIKCLDEMCNGKQNATLVVSGLV